MWRGVTIVFVALGALSAFLAAWIMDRMPAKCFCDYDETPEDKHLPPRVSTRHKCISAAVLAAIFYMMVLRYGGGLISLLMALFCTVLIMIALSDLKYCIIPDELIIADCVLAVVVAMPHIFREPVFLDKLSPVFGALIGGGLILLINLLGRLLYKKDALGMGDLKLMVICGIVCGAGGTLMALVIGILAAALFFAVGMVCKRIRQGDYLPLGPFLVFGALFTLCFRPFLDRLLAWYISLL